MIARTTRPRDAAEGPGRLEPAHGDARRPARILRAVLLGGQRARFAGTGELRGRQRDARRTGPHRRAAGLPATAINWGPWADSGMAAEAGRGEAVKSRGMQLIPPEVGLELLGKLLRTDAPQVAVMDAQWGDMLQLLGLAAAGAVGRRRGAKSTGAAAPTRPAASTTRSASSCRQPTTTTRHTLVRDYIQRGAGPHHGRRARRPRGRQPLSTFGLDSLLALELKNNLEGRLDFTLPMAKLMEGPRSRRWPRRRWESSMATRFDEWGSDLRASPLAKASSPRKPGRRWLRCRQPARGRRSCCCRRWAATLAAMLNW